MIVLSVGLYELAYFHLISHALFKSLLFLCAGYFIHAGLNCQDIRLVGKRCLSFPGANTYFVGCSLSLCGFPFLAGFYSKDLILESYFFGQMNSLIYLFIVVGTMFTIMYSVRLYYYLYVKNSRRLTLGVSETLGMRRVLIEGPITVLFIFSVVVGSWFAWSFMPPSVLLLPTIVKSIILLGIVGLAVNFIGVKNLGALKEIGNNFWLLNIMSGHIWFLPFISSINPTKTLKLGKRLYRFIDNGWLEFMGGQGGILTVISISRLTDKWNVLRIKFSFYLLLLVLMLILLAF